MKTIRQQRLQQGLLGRELAERMGVSPARISVLERDEDRGAVTLAMLQKAAVALGCRLEYRLVPDTAEPGAAGAANAAAKPRLRLRYHESEQAYRQREE